MRKLASILLLICLALVLFGYHLVFHSQLQEAKSEMKAFLKKKDLHKDLIEFSFTGEEASNLEWEESHEFRYNNEMYDVVEKTSEGDHLIIRCIADKKETALVEQYRRENEQRRSTSSVVQLITTTFILPENHSLQHPEKMIKSHFHDAASSIRQLPSSIFIPPPEAC